MKIRIRDIPELRIQVGEIGLGGHEYTPDGALKGFSDDGLDRATQPGYVRDDFGGPMRAELVRTALELGVSYFDATIDPEVSALGRLLAAVQTAAARDAIVQVRPQAMCYGYDPGNPRLVDAHQLRTEVQRLTDLLGRPVTVLNLGIEKAAAEQDPDYFTKLFEVLNALRSEGLMRFVACDSLLSGEAQYERMIASGAFDLAWLSFGPLHPRAAAIADYAQEVGMGVVAREVFAKGALFRALAEDGQAERSGDVAAAAIRWVLHYDAISTLVIGAKDAHQFTFCVDAARQNFSADDQRLLDEVSELPASAREMERYRKAW